MISLLPLLLHRLHEYGYPVLWLSVFIAAVGVPLPIGLLLLAVGAFAGYGDFNIVLLIVITITASSSGDNVGYFIGRRWGSRTLNWFLQPRRVHVLPARTITRSRLYFKRRGGWAIFFSRFLGKPHLVQWKVGLHTWHFLRYRIDCSLRANGFARSCR